MPKKEQLKLKEAARFLDKRLGINIYDDPYQQRYAEAIIAPAHKTQAMFVDAMSGTGKTSLAVGLAYLLLESGYIDQIVYVRNTVAVADMGFLPGDVEDKEAPYMQAGLDALSRVDPSNPKLIESMIISEKLVVTSTAFLRGVDWSGRKFVIVDEAQNMSLHELQTILTRLHDTAKVAIIGSSLQCDEYLPRYGKERLLPFNLYAVHFSRTDLPVENIELYRNYRGAFSLAADRIHETANILYYTGKQSDEAELSAYELEPLQDYEDMMCDEEAWAYMEGRVHE